MGVFKNIKKNVKRLVKKGKSILSTKKTSSKKVKTKKGKFSIPGLIDQGLKKGGEIIS